MTGQSYRFTVGTVDCLVIQDSETPFSEERAFRMYAQVPADELRSAMQRLPSPPLYSMNCFIIEASGERILVDTGLGPDAPPGMGCLLDGLRAADISPADITIVFTSHCHGDHVGGLLDADGNLAFPNARYIMNKDEWDYWSDDAVLAQMGERAQGLPKRFSAINGRLTLVEPGAEITPGVRTVAAYGHSPGQSGLEIESGGEGLLVLADTANTLMQMHHPDWSLAFDSQPDISPITRWSIFGRAADSGYKTAFYHLPFPGVGHMIRTGDAFDWKPI